MPETQTTNTGKETLIGPDGKYYDFPKGTTAGVANKYFQKKGITSKKTTPEKKPEVKTSGSSGDYGTQASVRAKTYKDTLRNTADYVVTQAPNVLGVAGSSVGKSVGSAAGGVGAVPGSILGGDVGGTVGSLIQTAGEKMLYGSDYGPHGYDIFHHAAAEGLRQAGWAGAGEAVEKGLQATKFIPSKFRLKVTNGIPKFPWEVNPNKVSTWFGSIMDNLFGSSHVIVGIREGQTKAVMDAGEKLASSFSKFKGNSTEMGELLQKSLNQARESAFKKLGRTPTSAEIKAFDETFNEGFINSITGKGTVASGKKAGQEFGHYVPADKVISIIRGLDDTKNLTKMIEILKTGDRTPSLNMIKTRLIKDVMAESVYKATNPINPSLKGQRFLGPDFLKGLNDIGRPKLDLIYGKEGAQKLYDFAEFTKNINGGISSGIGRWLNFGLAAGLFIAPTKTIQKLFGLNVIARMVSTEEGQQFLKNYEIALAKHAPQAIHAAGTALKTAMQHADLQEKEENQRLKDIEDKAEKEYLSSYKDKN